MTSIYNRVHIDSLLAAQCELSKTETSQLSVMLLDIDDFKFINACFGHHAGDYVLKQVASLLKKAAGPFDLIGRYGGEEFLIVLPNTSPASPTRQRNVFAPERPPLWIANVRAHIDGPTKARLPTTALSPVPSGEDNALDLRTEGPRSMPNTLLATTPLSSRRYVPGLAAGSIGGFISGFVKLGWEVPWPPRAPGRIPEPQVLVSLFTHHPTPGWVSLVIHFTFSILCGAAYGLLAEIVPIVTLGTGVAFGLAIWIGAHELVMPWIGLTPPAMQLPASEQGSEFFGHALWGWVIAIFHDDLSRRFTRSRPSS